MGGEVGVEVAVRAGKAGAGARHRLAVRGAVAAEGAGGQPGWGGQCRGCSCGASRRGSAFPGSSGSCRTGGGSSAARALKEGVGPVLSSDVALQADRGQR